MSIRFDKYDNDRNVYLSKIKYYSSMLKSNKFGRDDAVAIKYKLEKYEYKYRTYTNTLNKNNMKMIGGLKMISLKISKGNSEMPDFQFNLDNLHKNISKDELITLFENNDFLNNVISTKKYKIIDLTVTDENRQIVIDNDGEIIKIHANDRDNNDIYDFYCILQLIKYDPPYDFFLKEDAKHSLSYNNECFF